MNPSIRKFLSRALLLSGLASLALGGCGTGTTEVGNPTKRVIFGSIQNSVSKVRVPLESLGGDASKLGNIFLKVIRNGTELAQVSAQANFNAAEKAVFLDITGAVDGDTGALIVKGVSSLDDVYSSLLTLKDKERPVIDCVTSDNEAVLLFCAVCDEITACEPSLEKSQCLAGLISDQQVQLTNEFGVPVEENSISMQALVEGVEAGIFNADLAFFNQCLGDLAALTCEEVASGYSANDPDNFDNVENFIPGKEKDSCGEVFGTEEF